MRLMTPNLRVRDVVQGKKKPPVQPVVWVGLTT
jgi:hypothetical protein